MPEEHLLGRPADPSDPAGVLAGRQRDRDEGVADVVLAARAEAGALERDEPDPLVEPLLGERLPGGVGEHVVLRTGRVTRAAQLHEQREDLRVVRAVDLAWAGLRLSLDAAEAGHAAGVDGDDLAHEVEVPEAERDHL